MSGSSLTVPMKVNYATLSWAELVRREWGTEWSIPDTVYEFSNGAKRQSTDMTGSGIYGSTAAMFGLTLEAPKYQDMAPPYLLQAGGGHLTIE